MALHRFHGGLRLPGLKAELSAQPIRPVQPSCELVIPLLQHIGEPAEPCVEPGQRVRRGDPLGSAGDPRAVPVHASADGIVIAIEARPLPHPSGLPGPCVVLRPDAAQTPTASPAVDDWRHATREQLIERIQQAGIVGLGGAAFPTAAKIEVPRRLLILNGAECEPTIACDDRLLQERAADVLAGGRMLAQVVGADRVMLAVEDTMPAALAALQAALGDADDITLASVPTVYPTGGERQLIRVLTGLEVPQGGLPRDLGIVVQNVATAAAVCAALQRGEPLTSRIVTVTGRGVREPGNFEVPIGMPIAALIEQAGGYTDIAARLVIGGPLMGLALPHDGYPVTKGSNCVLVLGHDDIRDPAPELPCIRCGTCADACPAQLLPQLLLLFERAEQWPRLVAHGLFDCIECGCCDLACPSHIPLVEHFRYGKSALRWRDHEAAAAAAAKRRFEARSARLEREAAEREARAAARRAATSDAVQAALAKARQRSGADDGH